LFAKKWIFDRFCYLFEVGIGWEGVTDAFTRVVHSQSIEHGSLMGIAWSWPLWCEKRAKTEFFKMATKMTDFEKFK